MKKYTAILLSLTLALTAALGLSGNIAEAKKFEEPKCAINGLVDVDPADFYFTDEESDYVSHSYGLPNQSFWGTFSDRYFYNNMNSAMRNLYDNLDKICTDFFYNGKDAKYISKEAVYTLPEAADYSGLSRDDAYQVYIVYSNANPQYYFLSAGCLNVGTGIYPCIYDAYAKGSSREYYNTLFENTINSWINDVNSQPTLYDREYRIYTLLAEKLTYATGAWDDHQSSATAVFTGVTVCAGYAECFAMLAKAAGIPVLVITSYEHEWVQVQLDGNWYNADITFDDNGTEPRWRFFNKSDQTFAADRKHAPEEIFQLVNRPLCLYDYDANSLQPEYPTPVTPVVTPTTPNTSSGNSVEMYRLYNKSNGEHFYTSNANERDNLSRSGWIYEGVAWYASSNTSAPVYRMYNPNVGDHHYTTSASERDFLVGKGWKYEGVGWNSDPNMGVAMFRLYNPNAKTGSHHYTSSADERDMLVRSGWVNEGIGFYGIK